MNYALESKCRSPEPVFTLADWEAMAEDESGEYVDGRLVEEEVASAAHELIVSMLHHVLWGWLGDRGGYVGGSDLKFAVRENRGRKPDLVLYLPGGHLPSRRGLLRRPPDVFVEVVSPTPRDARRDRIEKLADYAAFGVRWYWIVDPELRSFQVYELGRDGRYVHALGATEGDVTPVPGCDGLTLDLGALWAKLETLPDEEETEESLS